jgi:hypothetical protein
MVMLVTLIALLIMALVSVVIARIAATEIELAGNYRGGHQAFFAADGGAEVGLNELRELCRRLGRFPTAAELATIGAPAVTTAGYTAFSVAPLGPEVVRTLDSGFYQGLVAMTRPFAARATAETTLPLRSRATVEMAADFDIIPIFQFAVFYEDDLEILPGPDMMLNGRVHSNADIYIGCNNTLRVDSSMTAAGDIFNFRKNNGLGMGGSVRIRNKDGAFPAMAGLDSSDPAWMSEALNRWDGNVRSRVHDVTRLNLAIEDPSNPHTIIEPGLPGDSAGDQSAKIYYQAELRILNGQGFDENDNPVSLIDPWTGTSAIRSTVIFDQREQKDMLTVEVDMDKLGRSPGYPGNGVVYVGAYQPGGGMPAWPEANPGVGPVEWVGYDTPWSGSGTTEFAVKLTHGAELDSPLSVISENPVYVQGNYNTVDKKGAAVMADAITVLSNRWGDTDGDGDFDDDRAYSMMTLNDRNASSTTINAAFMMGNTSTVPGVEYNGGVENLPRFLERWTGDTFRYRGSLIDLWGSIYATGTWIYDNPVYQAPNRDWAFDTDFLQIANQPPATPRVYTIRVVGWQRQ